MAGTPKDVMRQAYDDWRRKMYPEDYECKWSSTLDAGLSVAVQYDEATLRAALAIRSAYNRSAGKPLGS